MTDWDAVAQYLPPYALMLIATGALVFIAYCIGRVRQNLRAMHFILANEFADRHDLGKIDLKEIP